MELLYLDKRNVVKISKEGMADPTYNTLFNSDKTSGKRFFNNAITYIYWVYIKDGLYRNLSVEDRRVLVCKNYVSKDADENSKEKKVDTFEKNGKIKRCIERFIECTYTPTDRLHTCLKNDIDNYISYLSNVPYTKKEVLTFEVEHEGNTHRVEKEVDVDNSKDKKEAIKTSKELILYKKELEELIEIEKLNEVKDARRLFDETAD